jgi:hypothetical protein
MQQAQNVANQAALAGAFANYQDATKQANDDGCDEIVYGPSGGSLQGQPIQDDLIDARFTKDTAFYATAFCVWVPLLGGAWVHWFVNPVPSHKTQKKVKTMSVMRFARGWGFLFAAQYMTQKKNAAPKFWQQFTSEADKQITSLYVNMIIEFVLTALTNMLVGLPKQVRHKALPKFLLHGIRQLQLKQICTISIFFLLLIQVFTTFVSLVDLADMCKPYLLALNVDFMMLFVFIVVLYILHHQNVYVMICHMMHLKSHDQMLTALEHYEAMHLVNDFESCGLLKPSFMSGLAREDLLTLLQKDHVTIEDPFKVNNLIDFHTKSMAGRYAPVGISRQICLKNTGNADVDGVYTLQRFSLYYKGRHVWKNAKGKYLYFKPGWKSIDFFYGCADMVCRCCLNICFCFASQNIAGMSCWCVSEELGQSRGKAECFFLDYWHADDPCGLYDPLGRGFKIECVEPENILVSGSHDELVNGIYSLMPEEMAEWEDRRVWKEEFSNYYLFFARTKGRNEKIYRALPRFCLSMLDFLPKCCRPTVKPPGWYIASKISDPETIEQKYFLPDPDGHNNPTLANDMADAGAVQGAEVLMFAELSVAKEDFRGSQSTCEKCGKPSQERFCKDCQADAKASGGGWTNKLNMSMSKLKSVNSVGPRNSATGGDEPEQPLSPPATGANDTAWAQPQPTFAAAPAAPAPATSADPEVAKKLADLQTLKDCGALDDGEFEIAKAKVMAEQPAVSKTASGPTGAASPSVSDISDINAGPTTSVPVAAAKAVARQSTGGQPGIAAAKSGAVAKSGSVARASSGNVAVAKARASAPAMTPEMQNELKKLQELKAQGILDDAEYEQGRKTLMNKAAAAQQQQLPGALPPGPEM